MKTLVNETFFRKRLKFAFWALVILWCCYKVVDLDVFGCVSYFIRNVPHCKGR